MEMTARKFSWFVFLFMFNWTLVEYVKFDSDRKAWFIDFPYRVQVGKILESSIEFDYPTKNIQQWSTVAIKNSKVSRMEILLIDRYFYYHLLLCYVVFFVFFSKIQATLTDSSGFFFRAILLFKSLQQKIK